MICQSVSAGKKIVLSSESNSAIFCRYDQSALLYFSKWFLGDCNPSFLFSFCGAADNLLRLQRQFDIV